MAGYDVMFAAFIVAVVFPLLGVIGCFVRQRMLLWRMKYSILSTKGIEVANKLEYSLLAELKAKLVEVKLKQLLIEDLVSHIKLNGALDGPNSE